VGQAQKPRTVLSRDTNARFFHTSNAPKKMKIDPSRYQQNVSSKIDSDTIRRFRRMEDRYKQALEPIPKEHYEKNTKLYWPNKAKDEDSYQYTIPPDPMPQTAQIEEKPYDMLNMDKDDDFAKVMSFISSEQSNLPDEESYVKERQEDDSERFTINEVLKVGRHTQVTAGGRVYSFSALVMIGTGRGTAGLGYARGNSVVEAVALAKKQAEKNLLSIDLWRGYHIGADIKERYKKSYVWMRARRPGSAKTCGYEMGIVLKAFGINDIIMGHGGSHNKHTLYRAIWKALRDRIRSPEKVSRMLGRKLFNRAGAFYYTTD